MRDGAATWVKSQENTIKVTVDATIFEDNYAFGIVARDSAGDMVQARTVNHPGYATPELVEAQGIKESLCGIKKQS